MLDLSIAEVGRRLRAKTLTSEALTTAALSRIAETDPKLHAFVLVTGERAMDDARRADQELASGTDRGPLHGIPHALKDIFDTASIRTTCHSKLRVNHVPAADSVVAQRLAESGAVLLGKLATHEFAIGGPSFDLPFPPARNPWNTAHITGGSSSGSGAAIAAGVVRFAMGSDTGGSIRGPAAWCGTVGIKPTYGRISRRGVFPLAYSLDHAGPLARTVEDAAIVLQAIAGFDPHDPASADVPVPNFSTRLEGGVEGLRIGVPRAFFAGSPNLDRRLLAEFDRLASLLREHGAMVQEAVLPDYALFAAAGRIILTAEAFAVHAADLRTRLGDYGVLASNRFLLGVYVSGEDLVQAQRLRRRLTTAVDRLFDRFDALLTLTSLVPAPPFDAVPDSLAASGPMQTLPFNVTGHPAMSVPIGLIDGLPAGVQVIGPPFDEATVFRVGRAIEQISGWESVALPRG